MSARKQETKVEELLAEATTKAAEVLMRLGAGVAEADEGAAELTPILRDFAREILGLADEVVWNAAYGGDADTRDAIRDEIRSLLPEPSR